MTLIIEKKSDLIDHTKVSIPNNYVLVLPDENFRTYQLSGRETGIEVGTSIFRDMAKDDDIHGREEERVDNIAQHFSVRGKVMGVCDKLIFRKKEVLSARRNFSMDRDTVAYIGGLIKESVDYDVDIEVEKGDEVVFDYLSHISCYEDGAWMETELGDMYLIRYDALVMSIKPDGSRTPLNGWVIAEVEKQDLVTESGIHTPFVNDKAITDMKFAHVLECGKPIRSYKHDFHLGDDPIMFEKGDRICYRPGGSQPLEWVLHQTLYPGQEAVAVRRKDIFYVDYGSGI